MEERKFVCKYCSKRFRCGKSLGGHIRTHMIEERNNNAECDNLNFDAVRMKKRDLWCDQAGGGNSSIYGLRENPKKTMRFVHHSGATLEQEVRYCKECGKGFPSLKALCGHMACHSDKDKGTNNKKFGNSEKQKLVMDSQSDTETCAIPKHPRRSKRMSFKTLSLINHPYSSVPLANGSSSVSEVEQEQEEVARCLMLLSKDSSHKGRFASVTDQSSDNNSVVLEATKSSSVDMRIGINNCKNFFSKGYDLVEKKVLKDIKLKSADNSDSGYFRYGPKTKIAESDVSNEEFKSEFEDYNVRSTKMLNMNKDRSKYNVTVFKKSVVEDLDYDRTDGTARKFGSRKIASYDSFGYSKKTAKGFANDEIYETCGKGWKYDESLVDDDSTDENDENSSDSDSFPAPKSHHNSKVFNGKKSNKAKKKLKSKKSKEHECPICYKIFRSGQALGGHKRSHFVGGSEENSVVIKQGAPAAVPCLIDLNLPAPVDE